MFPSIPHMIAISEAGEIGCTVLSRITWMEYVLNDEPNRIDPVLAATCISSKSGGLVRSESQCPWQSCHKVGKL